MQTKVFKLSSSIANVAICFASTYSLLVQSPSCVTVSPVSSQVLSVHSATGMCVFVCAYQSE